MHRYTATSILSILIAKPSCWWI